MRNNRSIIQSELSRSSVGVIDGGIMTRIFLALSVLAMPCVIHAGSAAPLSDSESVLEEVRVIGKQPGPKMWRVSKGEHELWILGVLSPLPKDMEWDSDSVEAVLADSEEVIFPPGISLTAGVMKGIFSLPLLWGIRNNPGKETLHEILPEELYQRWSVLKNRYLGSGKKIEKRRPLFAAFELYQKAMEQSGLASGGTVYPVVNKLIKKYRIRTTNTGVSGKIEDPRRAIKNFKRTSIDDIGCFKVVIDRLETDLKVMRLRASAWASGDLAALRSLPYEDQNMSCVKSIMGSAYVTDLMESSGLTNAEETMRDNWIKAIENALANNEVTFAILPIPEILSQDGYLSMIRNRGYVVKGG